MTILKYLVWALPILFFSCETTIDVELPQEPSKLVVNCILNQDSTMFVSLSKSEMVDVILEDWNVSDAKVELYKNGAFVEELTESSWRPGFYWSTQTPENNATYTVKVQKEGFEPVEGSTYFSQPVNIENVTYSKTKFGYDSLVRFDVTFTDPETTDDFYTIEVYERNAYYDVWSQDTGYDFYRVYIYDTYDVVFENNYPNGEFGTFFNDELINGKTYSIAFSIYWDPYYNLEGFDREHVIVLGRTDEAHYRYNKSFTYYLSSYYNPFSEPVQVYSNISNGYGVIGSKSVDLETIEIK